MEFAKIFNTADGGQVLYHMHCVNDRLVLSGTTLFDDLDVAFTFTYGDPEDTKSRAARQTYFDGLTLAMAETFRASAKDILDEPKILAAPLSAVSEAVFNQHGNGETIPASLETVYE